MTERIKRFKKRQSIASELNFSGQPRGAEQLFSTTTSLLAAAVYQDHPYYELSEIDGVARHNELADTVRAQRFDHLLDDAFRRALQAIIVPFGLGKILSVYDRVGGNVDTINNVRQGVYATDEERDRYKNLSEYDPDDYHGAGGYTATNRKMSEQRKAGKLADAYTGDLLEKHQSHSLDHTISAKEIHCDPARVLAEASGTQLANDSSNLNATSRTTNSSKGAKAVEDYVEALDRDSTKRKKEAASLAQKQAEGIELTHKEKNRLNKLIEQEKISSNPDLIVEKDKVAREKYEYSLSHYYSSEKFRKQVIISGAQEGGKMAFQQAFGCLLVELMAALIDEIRDWYRGGGKVEAIATDLKKRLSRVADRVHARWQDAVTAGFNGFIGGFLGNLVTVIINACITTSARVVRMIREGATGVVSAAIRLILREENTSIAQTLHDASIIMFGSAILIAGIGLEEYLEKQLLPILGQSIAAMVAAVLIGLTTAIVTSLVVFLLDRLDIFGANAIDEAKKISQTLDQSIASRESERQALLLQIESLLT